MPVQLNESSSNMLHLDNWKVTFRMRCWPYSRIGPGIEFECNLSSNYFVDLVDGEHAVPVKSSQRREAEEENVDWNIQQQRRQRKTEDDNADCDIVDNDNVLFDKDDSEIEHER